MSTYGYFSETGSEYIITNPETKRFQMNYVWNSRFLLAVNQFGAGGGAYQNNAAFYISPKGRGAMLRNGNRYLYIKDKNTGKVWNPGWFPAKTPLDGYRCTHAQGYTKIEGEKDGVSVSWTLFVGTEAAECWMVEVKNSGKSAAALSLYPFVEFALDGYPANSGWHSWVQAYHKEKYNLLFAKNTAEERPHPFYNGFMCTDAAVSGFDTSKDRFVGPYGDYRLPDAIRDGACGNTEAACEDMVAAYEIPLTLSAGETKRFRVAVGISDSLENAEKTAALILSDGKMEADLAAVKENDARDLRFAEVKTPDPCVNHFTNFWLKKQTRLCAEIGRGAGKGFRDQLQDAWAIAAFQPEMAKDKIKEALEQIYKTGRCVRGWLPLKDRNCSDGPTWVAPTINAYLKETADYGFLNERVRYLDEGEDTVWEHILTTVRYSSNDVGEHGLVHIHVGDWNDSLNGMGKRGIGESVWTSIALYNALQAVIEISENVMHDDAVTAEMQERAARIKNAINEYGWDGEWYLQGYNDDGMKVGSKENEEGMIFMNPQVWSVMTGIAEGERKASCLRSVEKYIETEYGALTLYPAYTAYRPDIGRLTGFIPGIWENGTPYCHGGAFKAVMECMDGRGNKAYETLQKIFPDSKENPVEHSGAEPYALTNMYFGPQNPRAGQTQFSWVTGTAGWVYRAVAQYMLGFHPEYDGVTLSPVLPTEWKTARLSRLYRGAIYDIEIRNDNTGKAPALTVDGKAVTGNRIPAFTDGKTHKITVTV